MRGMGGGERERKHPLLSNLRDISSHLVGRTDSQGSLPEGWLREKLATAYQKQIISPSFSSFGWNQSYPACVDCFQ
jgi:hypothetical protein